MKKRDGGGLSLTVSDDGDGLPIGFAPDKSNGLGMRVVSSSALKLDGTLTFGNGDKGSYFRLDF